MLCTLNSASEQPHYYKRQNHKSYNKYERIKCPLKLPPFGCHFVQSSRRSYNVIEVAHFRLGFFRSSVFFGCSHRTGGAGSYLHRSGWQRASVPPSAYLVVGHILSDILIKGIKIPQYRIHGQYSIHNISSHPSLNFHKRTSSNSGFHSDGWGTSAT